MVTAVANAVTEGAKVMQTPAGQKQLEQWTGNMDNWNAFWAPVFTQSFWDKVRGGIGSLFKGDLFK